MFIVFKYFASFSAAVFWVIIEPSYVSASVAVVGLVALIAVAISEWRDYVRVRERQQNRRTGAV